MGVGWRLEARGLPWVSWQVPGMSGFGSPSLMETCLRLYHTESTVE